MAIQYLLVTFAEQRTVLADGAAVGVTNHILLLPADEYQISLDGAGYLPASQDVALDGTSMVRPLVVSFTASVTASPTVSRGAPVRSAVVLEATTPPREAGAPPDIAAPSKARTARKKVATRGSKSVPKPKRKGKKGA
jgi:hypothetical protein